MIDARVGSDDTVYNNLKNRLDSENINLKNQLTIITGNEVYTNWVSGFIRCSTATIDIFTREPTTTYKSLVVSCAEGDVFTISGSSYGGAARIWAFCAGDGTNLGAEEANVTVTNKVITAPADSAYLVSNWYFGSERPGNVVLVAKNELLVETVKKLSEETGEKFLDATLTDATKAAQAKAVGDAINQITGVNKTLIPTKISALNFVKDTTNYVSRNDYETFYIPVKSGFKYVWTANKKANNPALRFVFSENVPAAGIAGTYLGEQFIYDKPVVYGYDALADGYLSVSVWKDDTDTNLMSVSVTYKGIIDDVLEDVDNISVSLRTINATSEDTICVGTAQRNIILESNVMARKIAYYTGGESPSTWPGGLAIYKNRAFIGYHNGYIGVFDISTGAYLGYTRAPQTGSHMNTLFFDYSIFDGGYPLLYVSYCTESNSDCYVYAIGEENDSYTLTLIQKIKYTGSYLVSGDSIDWCFDSGQNCLIALIGPYSGTNKILRFDKPAIGTQDVTLTDTDILSVVTTSASFTLRQSPAVNNGNMFILDGLSNGTLYVIDTITGNTINSFALAPIDSHEPEGISIYDRKVYINFHVGTDVISANLYELTF